MSARGPRDRDWLPAPLELEHAPELGVLAVLHRTLDVAVHALLASHPCLTDLEPSYRMLHLPDARAADVVLAQVHRLGAALDHYRAAIAALHASAASDNGTPAQESSEPGNSDDIPF